MQLSPQQCEQFEREGFILLRSFASPQQCHTLREAALEEIELRHDPIETEGEYTDTGNRTLRRLRQVYDRREEFRSWMTEPVMRPILREVLGDTPVITLAHHNSIMTKMPATSTETCWHQDRRYWSFENDNLVSIWLALGEETMHNGVLEFIPGSHKLDFRPEQFDARTCFRTGLEENDALIAKRVHFDLNGGDVVLFHCRTLHHAYDNRTDELKVSFVYTVRGKANPPIPGTRSSAHGEIELV